MFNQRKHIVFFGKTNAGKSALFNAVLGQQRAIVSDIPGTTTDPVIKAAEFLSFGPVALVDTAGLSDGSELGAERMKKTRRMLEAADLAVYVTDAVAPDFAALNTFAPAFNQRGIPYVVVLSKSDLLPPDTGDLPSYETGMSGVPILYVSAFDETSVDAFKRELINLLRTRTKPEPSLLAGLLPAGGVVVMVAPIDSEAPAGRLILPQSQLIRDCLDKNLRCHVTNEHTFPEALRELPRVDLVVTDSQLFGVTDKQTPANIPLTSFSILSARKKGNFWDLYAGAQIIGNLRDGNCVLIAESCTHNRSHEDIGRVKLPRQLEKYTGAKLTFDFCTGQDFPESIEKYDLVVHCGGCMATARAFEARQRAAGAAGVPMTNYGMALAYCTGTLERGVEIFDRIISREIT